MLKIDMIDMIIKVIGELYRKPNSRGATRSSSSRLQNIFTPRMSSSWKETIKKASTPWDLRKRVTRRLDGLARFSNCDLYKNL